MIKSFSALKKQLIIGFVFTALFTPAYSQESEDQKVVAIFPFHFASTNLADKKAISELNGLFYDLFAGQFTSTGYFEVVDRQHIQEMIGEIALQQSGITQEQVVTMGKAKGAELAIFGTVTSVAKQTFLTLKIIDIETTVILKSIKAKGSFKQPDKLALDAGFEFMKGLSQVLYSRYKIGAGNITAASKENLQDFLKARDLVHQAIIAQQDGNTGKKKSLQKQAEKYLQKIISKDPVLKSAVKVFRETTMRQLEE